MTTNNHNDTNAIANNARNSLYIAALDRYLGLRGFVTWVTDGATDLDYDFYHLESGTFVKIIDPLDAEDIDRYQKGRPPYSVFLVDARMLASGQEASKGFQSILDSQQVCAATLALDAYVYLGDELWSLNEENLTWTSVLPLEHRLCLKAIDNLLRQ